jgi:hypothetical protein
MTSVRPTRKRKEEPSSAAYIISPSSPLPVKAPSPHFSGTRFQMRS